MLAVIESTNPVVKAVIEGSAPRPARLAAARGMLPLPQNDLLEVLVAFAGSDDSELSEFARGTLASQDTELLNDAVRSSDIAESVLKYYAEVPSAPKEVHYSIVTNPRTPFVSILKFVRETKNTELLDVVSLNQQLLIQLPALIDAIIENPHSTTEAERRATETKQEFFMKERGQQQIANELRAQGKEAAAEFIEQADGDLSEDAAFIAEHVVVSDSETNDAWLALEFIEEIYEETEEQRRDIINKIMGEFNAEGTEMTGERVSILNRILKMGMKDRTKLAMKGDRESRNILIRDPNRIVAQAVVSNPRLTDQEAEMIASMRAVHEDVLRLIAINRQWNRSYAIIHNLAKNPRTPIANVMNILPRIQLKDLNAIAKNKNVPEAVRRQANRLYQARVGK